MFTVRYRLSVRVQCNPPVTVQTFRSSRSFLRYEYYYTHISVHNDDKCGFLFLIMEYVLGTSEPVRLYIGMPAGSLCAR